MSYLLDGRMAAQRRLDLAELDAVPANFHLPIEARQIFDVGVGKASHPVAGAIKPAAGRPERIGDEALGGECGPAPVAVREAVAADMQLACGAGRHRLEPGIQHVARAVGDRSADRHGAGVRHHLAHVQPRAECGGFGWPVHVEESMRRARREHGPDSVRISRLATEQQIAYWREHVGHVTHQAIEQGGRHERAGDAHLAQCGRE